MATIKASSGTDCTEASPDVPNTQNLFNRYNLKLQSCDGKDEDIDTFLSIFEQKCRINNVPRAHWIDLMSELLRGDARTALRSIPDYYDKDYDEGINNWNGTEYICSYIQRWERTLPENIDENRKISELRDKLIGHTAAYRLAGKHTNNYVNMKENLSEKLVAITRSMKQKSDDSRASDIEDEDNHHNDSVMNITNSDTIMNISREHLIKEQSRDKEVMYIKEKLKSDVKLRDEFSLNRGVMIRKAKSINGELNEPDQQSTDTSLINEEECSVMVVNQSDEIMDIPVLEHNSAREQDILLSHVPNAYKSSLKELMCSTYYKVIEVCKLNPTNECKTKGLMLDGAHGWSPTLFIRLVQDYGLENAVAQHLAKTYGDKAFKVASLSKMNYFVHNMMNILTLKLR
ncbi:hypothetical protein Btru_062116 [Bulinus truncatus]|nr:hypothetical protein Btru_062116 [Bulinus truncatus]